MQPPRLLASIAVGDISSEITGISGTEFGLGGCGRVCFAKSRDGDFRSGCSRFPVGELESKLIEQSRSPKLLQNSSISIQYGSV